jgi:hypothetical protein
MLRGARSPGDRRSLVMRQAVARDQSEAEEIFGVRFSRHRTRNDIADLICDRASQSDDAQPAQHSVAPLDVLWSITAEFRGHGLRKRQERQRYRKRD